VETKQDYKGRHGDSPDYSDALAVALEVMARNGVRLKPIRSDRDEAIIAATPPPTMDLLGLDSPEDDTLLRRQARARGREVSRIVTVTGIPTPKPPRNTALISEVRIRTHVPHPDDPDDPDDGRAREAILAMNRAFHGS